MSCTRRRAWLGKAIIASGALSLVGGVAVRVWVHRGAWRFATDEAYWRAFGSSAFPLGITLMALGLVLEALEKMGERSAGLSEPERIGLSRGYTFKIVKLVILLCLLDALLWGPVLLSAGRGEAIRPMVQVAVSLLLAASGVVCGSVVALGQAVWLGARMRALATLALGFVPLLQFLGSQWWLQDVMHVTYKP